MENDRLLKLLEDCTMTDEDAVGMIFSNFIDIGGTLGGSDSFTTDKKDDFDWCVEFESTENTDTQPKEGQDDGR